MWFFQQPLILVEFDNQMRDGIGDSRIHSTKDWPDLWADKRTTDTTIESWVDLLEFLEEGL